MKPGARLLSWLRRLVWRPPPTGCSAFCPGCGCDLTKSDAECIDAECVLYVCTCGVTSWWDFDAPVPLFLGDDARKGGEA